MAKLEAKSLKATVVLDAAAVASIQVQNVPKTTLSVTVAGRVVRADLNSKSLRRAIAAIAEAGPDNMAVILSGRLEAGDVLVDAGVAAQPRTAKPAVAVAV